MRECDALLLYFITATATQPIEIREVKDEESSLCRKF
jgi:hypothetical protein